MRRAVVDRASYRIGAVIAAVLLTAWAAAADAQPRIGASAPEITGHPWLNSPPLTMAGLRGRVVLVEFWTHG